MTTAVPFQYGSLRVNSAKPMGSWVTLAVTVPVYVVGWWLALWK
ncbi:MAG TPA: hypothetical protein PLD23_04840 [Armatimonadota bacterium]|nr:hypothetical protein [Armatimonadota bacterium]